MIKKLEAQQESLILIFDDNSVLAMLFGDEEANLARIEKALGIIAAARGNMVSLTGEMAVIEKAKAALENLYNDALKGFEIGPAQIDAALRMQTLGNHMEQPALLPGLPETAIKTLKKHVRPHTVAQARYMQSLTQHEMVFALGPAGTGKTYIAVAMAVAMFAAKRVERIILSRPAVEAGEKLGFLPGDLKEKIDPYLRPLYDALQDMMPADKLERAMETGEIEVAPLAFMRGRTLANAFVILDEAQNTTPTQMKMFLTRLGENSHMVITGDLSQTDLPRDIKSGLGDAIRKLEGIEEIGVTRFSDADVVRHPLAAKIVHAYDEWDKKKKSS